MEERGLVFLREASKTTLQAYELAERDKAANLAKQIKSLVFAMAEAWANADSARIEIDRRELRLLERSNTSLDVDPKLL